MARTDHASCEVGLAIAASWLSRWIMARPSPLSRAVIGSMNGSA